MKKGEIKMEKTLSPLLRPKQVADILGLKISTVYKYSRSGKLPTVKINGALRFSEDQIQDFIDQHKNPAIKSIVS